MSRKPQTLTVPNTIRLRAAHDTRHTDLSEALYATVKALRDAGWTLESIAAPVGVTHEAVRIWAKLAEARNLQPVTVDPPPRP